MEIFPTRTKRPSLGIKTGKMLPKSMTKHGKRHLFSGTTGIGLEGVREGVVTVRV